MIWPWDLLFYFWFFNLSISMESTEYIIWSLSSFPSSLFFHHFLWSARHTVSSPTIRFPIAAILPFLLHSYIPSLFSTALPYLSFFSVDSLVSFSFDGIALRFALAVAPPSSSLIGDSCNPSNSCPLAAVVVTYPTMAFSLFGSRDSASYAKYFNIRWVDFLSVEIAH